ncbi:hypothetical protein [Streptosporangium jomthongense]|uniref:Uncharacterized protein n=1 Tax=Streptosporangium jomthongense TaxID=1193683 RepID=A0ABV8FG71_9ACTN
MPSPDDTLAAIDDVITWYGSEDSMTWTAREPKRPDLSGLAAIVEAARPDHEALQQFGARVVEQFEALRTAFQRMGEQMLRNVGDAYQLVRRARLQELAEAGRATRRTMKATYHQRTRRRGRR